jgi:hypothetical protein
MLERQETLPMRRHRLLLITGAVALLGVAGFCVLTWLTSPTPGVTWENFRRLRLGMSARYVEALLGKPFRVAERTDCSIRFWRGEEVGIYLAFEADALVSGDALAADLIDPHAEIGPAIIGLSGPLDVENTGHTESVRPADSLLDRIRRWLRL